MTSALAFDEVDIESCIIGENLGQWIGQGNQRSACPSKKPANTFKIRLALHAFQPVS